MCDPISGTALALSAGSQVAGFVASDRQAKASSRYQNARYTSNAEAALGSYFDDLSRFQIRLAQEDEATAQQSLRSRREASLLRGQVASTAGARGVSGGSVDELMAEFDRLEAENQFSLDRNLSFLGEQVNAEMVATRAATQTRIASAAPQPVTRPSPLALGLGLGTSGINAYDNFEQRKLFRQSLGVID